MKKKSVLLVFLLLIGCASIFGDIRAPEPKPTPKPPLPKTIDSTLTIKLDENAKDAKLVIPKSQLKQLRAQIDDLDNENDQNASLETGKSGLNSTQTVVSGFFMSLALVFGGVWFARSKAAKNTKIVSGILILLLGGLGATLTFGNAGPPSELRAITSKLFDSKRFGYWNQAYGKIKLEVSPAASQIELIVPKIKEEGKDDMKSDE